MTAFVTSAQMIPQFPVHDWTIRIAGKQYGLIEYSERYSAPRSLPGYTTIIWANHQRSVRLNIYVVAAVPVLLLLVVVFLAARMFCNSATPQKARGETTVDAPT